MAHASVDRRVTRWLYIVAILTFCLIVFGGFVRLTRSGLSIVEWNPVTGVLPPLDESSWQTEFAKYQQTPEYRTVNTSMTLDGYKRIFLIEWAHRLIARIAGLVVVVPLVVFLWRGVVPWRNAGLYVGIALLFGLQGFLGWFMVRSGLLDTPSVSHYRLTIHLMTALLLLGVTTWAAMNTDARIPPAIRRIGATGPSRLALLALGVVLLQIAWGGLVAGLKAGHASATWPTMMGAWLPAGIFGGDSWWSSLTAMPAAVHWIHRWAAFVVFAIVVWLAVVARHGAVAQAARRAIGLTVILVAVQIALGVSVIWWRVPIALALLHQAIGLGIFTAMLVVNHRLLRQGSTT